jgi:hypothetical protein
MMSFVNDQKDLIRVFQPMIEQILYGRVSVKAIFAGNDDIIFWLYVDRFIMLPRNDPIPKTSPPLCYAKRCRFLEY